MWGFLQQSIDGLSAGAVYATIALALVLIYRSTGLVNFAQGEMAMFSCYLYISFSAAGAPLWIACCGAMLLSFIGGLVIERALFRRFGANQHLELIVVMLGLFVGFNALAGLIWSFEVRKVPNLFPDGILRAGKVVIGLPLLGTLASIGASTLCLYLLFRFTKLGLAMRGAVSNPQSAQLLGFRVGHLLGIGWGLAAALGCLAGVLVTPRLFLDPNVMQGVIVYAIAAATVGGLDSPVGAIVAGLAIGVMENLAGTYLVGSELRIVVPLILIVGFLLFRPSGLFGSAAENRV